MNSHPLAAGGPLGLLVVLASSVAASMFAGVAGVATAAAAGLAAATTWAQPVVAPRAEHS